MLQKLNLDKVGIGASLLCAIHCALLPVLFTTLPLMGVELLENDNLELGFILFSLIVGCLALHNDFRKHHHRILPLFVFFTGIMLLLFASFWLEDSIETIVKVAGAAFVITAHILNWYNCKQCEICQ